jgi:hypothetical protein
MVADLAAVLMLLLSLVLSLQTSPLWRAGQNAQC